jgi:hypothetical protein
LVERAGDRLDRFVRRWRAFWFGPTSTASLGLVRIAFGSVMVLWSLSVLPDARSLFGESGVAADHSSGAHAWGLFEVVDGLDARLLAVVLLVAAVALTVGWHSRVAALIVFVGILSFDRANPFALNTGDGLLRLIALYLAFAPTGAAYSLDRLRTTGSFWSAQVRAPWTLRLLQIQLSMIYLFSVLNKLSGTTWREGTAVSYALRLDDIATFALPTWLTTDPVSMNLATWGVLAAELAIGLLVWSPRFRRRVLTLGVVLHAVNLATFAVAFFSLAMFVLYLAFMPPATVERAVDAARRRVRSAVDGRLVHVEDGVAAGG